MVMVGVCLTYAAASHSSLCGSLRIAPTRQTRPMSGGRTSRDRSTTIAPVDPHMLAPRVSVVVPVRDGAAMLGRCLQAIGRNPRDLFEVIVVDDGSTDRSAEQARALGARVIQMPVSRGPAAARNAGAAGARGD